MVMPKGKQIGRHHRKNGESDKAVLQQEWPCPGSILDSSRFSKSYTYFFEFTGNIHAISNEFMVAVGLNSGCPKSIGVIVDQEIFSAGNDFGKPSADDRTANTSDALNGRGFVIWDEKI